MERHDFLSTLHERVRPRTYLETGVDLGQSLQLSRVPSVGIDPDYSLTHELQGDIQLARTTSDEFFARRRPLAHLPIPVVDLAFIDGMHLAEYALRDFLSVERFTHPTSVIVFDDMLPRSVVEANRKRTTRGWTGDVYKAAEALRTLCPGTVVLEVDTRPTGVVVVLCPDASRRGVLEGYDDWLERVVVPDPQAVPSEVLDRSRALEPGLLLAHPGWDSLVTNRDTKPRRAARAVRKAFSDLV